MRPKKLSLHKETLTALTPAQLAPIAGGQPNTVGCTVVVMTAHCATQAIVCNASIYLGCEPPTMACPISGVACPMPTPTLNQK